MDSSTPFIFVNNPFWLHEAYSDELPSLDTGVLQRNISLADRLSKVLSLPENQDLKDGIDVGGGYGLLVRALRDRGFDFYWSDPYCRNLFSKGFEGSVRPYDIVTAFEILEHVADPYEFVKGVVTKYSPKIFLFSTECFNPKEVPPEDWWYWSFETGQHIAFFSSVSLKHLANRIGYNFHDLGGSLYAFTKEGFEPRLTVPKPTIYLRIANRILRTQQSPKRPSLTFSDHEKIRSELSDPKSGIQP